MFKLNEKKYIEKIQNNNEEFMSNVIIACDLLLLDDNYSIAQRVLALRFLKNSMDFRNNKYAYYFQNYALETFHYIALVYSDSDLPENERGKNFFSDFPSFSIF